MQTFVRAKIDWQQSGQKSAETAFNGCAVRPDGEGGPRLGIATPSPETPRASFYGEFARCLGLVDLSAANSHFQSGAKTAGNAYFTSASTP